MKLEKLEVVRGTACLMVILNHIRIALSYFKSSQFDFLQILTAWGREAVIVFFILSGIVINIATKDKTTRFSYYSKRLVRLLPIYISAIIFTVLTIYIINRGNLDYKLIAGNLLMLQSEPGYITEVISYNPAVWSISCEVFFYAVFGLILYKKKSGIYYWFFLSLVCIIIRLNNYDSNYVLADHIIYMLYYSSIWILGYLIMEYSNKISANFPTAILSILLTPLITRIHEGYYTVLFLKYHLQALTLIPFFVYLVNKPSAEKKTDIPYSIVFGIYFFLFLYFFNNSNSTPFNKIFYSALPLSSLLFFSDKLKVISSRFFQTVKRPLIFIASISYALYLLHMPIMYLISDLLPKSPMLGCIIVFTLLLSLSFLLELTIQKKIVQKAKTLLAF